MAALSVPLAIAVITPSIASADTFLDVNSGLTGWTTSGTTTLLTTTETSNLGGSPFTLTPATGQAMVKIQADGSSINVSAVDSILGLANGTATAAIGSGSTNFGLITKSFSLAAGTYTFGWAYSAGDYLPYSDGVFFSVGGQGLSQFNILARNGESTIVPGSAGYPVGALILQSYGNTPWITASFSVSTAGSYQLGFGGFNGLDTSQSPILYVSSVIGSFTGTPVGTSGATPTPTSTDIDTAAPGGYDASQLGSTLNAVFAGGTLYFTTPGAFSQNFQLGNSATNTIDLRDVSVNLDGNLTDQTTGGSIIFANTGNSQTSILLNGNSTYTGSTTIENNVFLSLNGSINNTSHVQIKNGGLVIVRSGGAITAGYITNELGGQLFIEQGATVTDDLDNAGDVENAGTYNAIVNTNTGRILNLATGTWNGDVRSNAGYIANSGIMNGEVISTSGDIYSDGTWNGDVLSNTNSLTNIGTWNGNITTAGDFVNAGTLNGNLTNTGTAQVTGTINGILTNATAGSAFIAGSATIDDVSNSGRLTILDNATLNTQFVNGTDGQLSIRTNGTLNGNVSNAGSISNSGTLNGDVLSNADWIYSTGTWNGAVTANSGTVFNAGTWNGDVTNAGEFVSTGTFTGTLNTSGEAYLYGVINGAVTNTGTFTLQGNLTGNGSAFNNSGTLRLDDNGFNGFGAVTNAAGGEIWVGGFGSIGLLNATSLTNAGDVHMVNGHTGDVINITGAYTGTAGSVLSFDVDMLTGQADRLNVGTLSGTSTVRLYNSAAGRTYLSAPVVLVASGGGDGTLTADTDIGTAAVLGSQSLMSYRLAKIAGTNDWGIVSSLNTPSLTSLSASLTAYVTAQNLNLADLPEEVFVRDGTYGVNQWMANSWARAYSGDLSLKSGFTTSDAYSSGTTTKAKSSQDGVQYGFDAGVYNIHGTGVSLRAGFMGGSTDAKVTDETLSGSSVKIDAPNYGHYAALTHKGLRLSVQNRYEILKADVTNPALGLSNSRLKARSETFSVALSNRYDLNSLFVEPVIGYMTTKVDADTLDIPVDQGSVKIAELKSQLIRAGVRVGTSLSTERVIWTPYGELNAWQEDAAKTQTAYVPESGTGAVWLAGQRTGPFGQALMGVTAQSRSNENLSGHLTADARLGDTLNGWTVRAGVKYRLK
ncbi:hypothetical protein OVA03_13690 [Asticcacaulis sp. SL142]|uniref:hypothetical protein n=1 Tax=Asticcacaulis sp. SL142 TaxID=2995155 RepID=UPI00226C8295|nr:hypothetical protein [Asticcacaulis sp. SL142]WAC47745.1 hypothetical protein OVA03_13690 [Asticcacaulis sp. SL142]